MGGKFCCRDPEHVVKQQVANIRPATAAVDMWRYFVHADFQARYFWFKHARMLLLLLLIVVPEVAKAPPTATAATKAQADLSRSVLQASSLTVYLLLLVVLRPYVGNKYRSWKLYVTVFNNFTALTVVVARLVAEQASYVALERTEMVSDTEAGLVLVTSLVGIQNTSAAAAANQSGMAGGGTQAKQAPPQVVVRSVREQEEQ
jgi:hypothetical protein